MSRRRALWVSLVVLVMLGVLAAIALVALPGVLRQALIWRVQALTGREVLIDNVEFSPFSGRLSIQRFRLADRGRPRPLAEFDRLDARLHRRSLLSGQLWFEDISVRGSVVRVARTGRNEFNISDFLRRAEPARSPLPVTIDRLALVGGTLVLEDLVLTPARTWTAEKIDIQAHDLSTRRRDKAGLARLTATVAGAPLTLDVSDLRLVPIHLHADATVNGLDLAIARLYLPADLAVALERGAVSLGFTVDHDAREGTRLNGDGRLDDIVLLRRGYDGPFVIAPSLKLTIDGLALGERAVVVGRVDVSGAATIVDARVTPPARFDVEWLRVVGEALAWPARAPARVSVTAGLRGGGDVNARGTVALAPLTAELRVRLNEPDLARWAPYTPVAARVNGGAEADLQVVATHDTRFTARAQGRATVSKLSVADERRRLITADRLEGSGLDLEWPPKVRIDRLRVTRPSALVERDADGRFPLRDLVVRGDSSPAVAGPAPATSEPARTGSTSERVATTPAPAGTEPVAPTTEADAARSRGPEVAIAELIVEDGSARIVDAAATPAARLEVARVRATVRDATWPARGPARIQVTAGTPGHGTVAAQGTVRLDPPGAELRLVLAGVDLGPYQPYLPVDARVAGRADADLTLVTALDPDLRVGARGTAAVDELAISDGDQPRITVERIEGAGIDARWPGKLAIDRLRVHRSWALIERETSGRFPLRALLATRGRRDASATPTPGAATTPLFEVEVREGVFEDGATTIVDAIVTPPARFDVAGARLTIRDLTWPPRGPTAVRLTTPMPGGGDLDAQGTLALDVSRAALQVVLKAVDLAPAQPYLPIEGRIAGKTDAELAVTVAFPPFRVTARGTAGLNAFALGDRDRSLVTADRVETAGIDAEWPGRLAIQRVRFRRPVVLLEREQDGRFPLLALLRRRATDRDDARPAGDPADAPPTADITTEIAELVIEDGFGRFVDHTTTPAYVEEASRAGVTLTGLTTASGKRGHVVVRTVLGGGATLALEGEVAALAGPLDLDVTGELRDFVLPRANPYLDRLFSWVARRGQLTTSVHYRIEGDRLTATNDLLLEHLDVAPAGTGDEVQRRIGLPVGLLVSLLKDARGEIRLAVPVTGDLGARQFDFGETFWSALRSVAINVLARPLSWIGRLYYSEDAKIEGVAIDPLLFEPGGTTLGRDMPGHVDRLAAFLRETPAIALTLKPVITLADISALKRAKVSDDLRAAGRQGGVARTPLDAAARRFAEKLPGQPIPATLEEIVDALARDEPEPAEAVRDLGARRVEATRAALARAVSLDTGRLQPSPMVTAVEFSGTGRVEFEVIPAVTAGGPPR